MKARAPIGRLRRRDWKTVKPMPLKTMGEKVVTAPEPVQETMERMQIPHSW